MAGIGGFFERVVSDRDKEFLSLADICFFFIPKGEENNPGLMEQIDIAKKEQKPVYLLMQTGAEEPSYLQGVNVHTVEYFNGVEDKEGMRTAVRNLIKKAVEDSQDQ